MRLILLAFLLASPQHGMGPGPGVNAYAASSRTFVRLDNVTLAAPTCDANDGPCYFTVTSTGTGNLIVLFVLTSSDAVTFASACIRSDSTHNCTSPTQQFTLNPANCHAANSGNSGIFCAYILSSTSGATSVVYSTTFSHFNRLVCYERWSYTGSTLALDQANNTTANFGSNPAAPTLGSLTGTDDAVFTAVSDDGGGTNYTAINQSFTFRSAASNAGGCADKMNVASYTAPTWTQSTNHHSAESAIAFK